MLHLLSCVRYFDNDDSDGTNVSHTNTDNTDNSNHYHFKLERTDSNYTWKTVHLQQMQ